MSERAEQAPTALRGRTAAPANVDRSKSGMGRLVHHRLLEIFGDVLELVDRLTLVLCQRTDGLLQTMIEMVLD